MKPDADNTGPRYFQMRDFERALNSDVLKKSEGSPPWIKTHCGQMEDPEYTMLTLAERGLLHDLRLLAARRGNKILWDTSYLSALIRPGKGARLMPGLGKLFRLKFIEEFNLDTNPSAKRLLRSRDVLEALASQEGAEERREEENYPLPPTRQNRKTVASAEAWIRNVGWTLIDDAPNDLEHELAERRNLDELTVKRLIDYAAQERAKRGAA